MPRITVMSGRKTVGVHDLRKERTLIGRSSSADILLDNPVVSREHAEVLCMGDDYLINNLAGRNGVFVNGKWVDTLDLKHGDIVEIGTFTLRFEDVPLGAPRAERFDGGGPGKEDGGGPSIRKLEADTVTLDFDELARVRATMALVKQAHLEQRTADGQTGTPAG